MPKHTFAELDRLDVKVIAYLFQIGEISSQQMAAYIRKCRRIMHERDFHDYWYDRYEILREVYEER